MERPKLFGDIYDIISCCVFIVIGVILAAYALIDGYARFLYAGLLLIVVFTGLLLFSYYARYYYKFREFKLKSVFITTILVIFVLIILGILFIMI